MREKFDIVFHKFWKFIKRASVSRLAHNIALLFIAFVLTQYFGNKLASSYQERLWEHQHKVTQQEAEIAAASKVFEEISKITDKRIYRMQQLNWWLRDNTDQKRIKQQMDMYRKVLYEWNDSFNRNRALVLRYFGKDTYNFFSENVYKDMKESGKILEDYFYLSPKQRNSGTGAQMGDKLGDLGNKAYELNLKMIELIQNGQVGVFNPEVSNSKK